MKMKLPDLSGRVIVIKSDQEEARKCYENSLKTKRGVIMVMERPPTSDTPVEVEPLEEATPAEVEPMEQAMPVKATPVEAIPAEEMPREAAPWKKHMGRPQPGGSVTIFIALRWW